MGCSAKESTNVKRDSIGEWISRDKSQSLYISPDHVGGTAKKNGVSQSLLGDKKWINENTIAGVWEKKVVNWVMRIWGDKMVLTSDDGRTLTMYREFSIPIYSGKIDLTESSSGLPPDSWIDSISVDPKDPNIIFASGTGFTYKSIDGGKTWAGATNTISFWVHKIVFDPLSSNTIYATTVTDGVMKSDDMDNSWAPFEQEFPFVISMAIDPSNSDTIYITPSEKGIFKSNDGGKKWIESNSGLPDLWSQVIAINPSISTNLFTNTISRGMFTSTDGGNSWKDNQNWKLGFHITDIVFDRQVPPIMYIVADGVLFKSSDNGMNFVEIENEQLSDINLFCVDVDPVNSNILYLGSQSGIYKLTLTP